MHKEKHSTLIYGFSTIPIEITANFFAETEKLIIKFVWKCQGLRIAKTFFGGETGGLSLSNLKTYYKATIIKTVWCWHRHMDQWNKIESTEINPLIYSHMIFDKGTKTI